MIPKAPAPKLVKISKRMARKLYADGHPVVLLPVHMAPGNPWIQPFKMSPTDHPTAHPDDLRFEHRVKGYMTFTCTDRTVGTYPSFYVEAIERTVSRSRRTKAPAPRRRPPDQECLAVRQWA